MAPKSKAPIFQKFTIEQLADMTGYSAVYLEDLRTGRQDIRPRFKRTVGRILGRTEAELFDEPVAEPEAVAS